MAPWRNWESYSVKPDTYSADRKLFEGKTDFLQARILQRLPQHPGFQETDGLAIEYHGERRKFRVVRFHAFGIPDTCFGNWHALRRVPREGEVQNDGKYQCINCEWSF